MKWIDVKETVPIPGRYLVVSRCKSGMHNCLAWNYSHPCCEVNIAYYISDGCWEWATDEPIKNPITHYMELPVTPEHVYERD